MSRCSERSAATATGPTSASDGVRTPPVSTTVWSPRPPRSSTSATWTELVTTVSPATSRSCRASVQRRRAGGQRRRPCPGSTSAAAASAMACFSSRSQDRLRLEARLVGAVRPGGGRAAVDLVHQAAGWPAPRGRGGSSCPRRRAARSGRLTRTAPARGPARGCAPAAAARAPHVPFSRARRRHRRAGTRTEPRAVLTRHQVADRVAASSTAVRSVWLRTNRYEPCSPTRRTTSTPASAPRSRGDPGLVAGCG